MKRLKFRKELAEMILAGTKTVTWRFFDDKNISVGDKLRLCHEDGKIFGHAQVVEISEKPFHAVSESDRLGHESFANAEIMLATYQEYYGESVNWNSIMKVIRFKPE
jgi:hypothetical protein